jgi:predicted  nucleic acid-binding Zn-ribbon protein
MEDKIKLLYELQEFDLVLTETKIVHGDSIDLATVHDKVNDIREKLDKLTLSRYDRLQNQGLAVVHERNGMCLGCNMVIPAGDLNRIKSRKMEEICPHCGKFILLAEIWEDIIADRLKKAKTKKNRNN